MKKLSSFILTAVFILSVFSVLCGAENSDSAKTDALESAALYWKVIPEEQTQYKTDISTVLIDGIPAESEKILLDTDSVLSFEAEAESDGIYILALTYSAEEAEKSDIELEVSVGGKTALGKLPVLWSDSSKDYALDRNGDEQLPLQVAYTGVLTDTVYDSRSVNSNELGLELKKGKQVIYVKNLSPAITVSKLMLYGECETEKYADYISKYRSEAGISAVSFTEGEDYLYKSESYIRGKSTKNPFLSPYRSGKKSVCVLDGSTWSSAGQKVIWSIEAPEDGLYELSMHYSMYTDTNQHAYRYIEIDGQVPFGEFESVKIPSTQSDEYENYTLSDESGTPYRIFLTKGIHTVSMKVTMGEYEEIYNELLEVMNSVNEIGLNFQKLSAGSSDSNRTWDIESVLPGSLEELEGIADDIDGIYEALGKLSGEKPAYADNLVYAADSLRKLLEEPRVLPNKTNLLNVGDNSVSKYLGTVLSKLVSSPVSVDTIYISSGEDIPERKVSLLFRIWEGIREFVSTFVGSYNGYNTDISGKEGSISVWINRSVQYTDALQRLIDRDYNSLKNTNIRLSIMPSEQKLILANASGTNPDAVLGVAYTTPFDFAIRNAAVNLLEFDDFYEFYNDDFNSEALVPFGYDGGVYAIPETLDFNILFYRRDILETLGLEVPQTWDDVKYLMPTLLGYGMNFYIPLSASSGYKPLSATSPFLFQNGASLYTDGGSSVAFNSDNGTKAFTEMIDLYKVYSLQQSVPSFYNSFRYTEIPIGIGNSTLYLQLTSAAPELSGLWEIALAPGTENDGEILRYQPADVTACMIFKNSDRREESWDFLKWWMSSETQTEYAYTMSSTYGPEYFWCTANLKAFSELSIPQEHKDIILEQWKWQKEVPRHPANYMIERSVSNVWNYVVVNGKELSDAIDNATLVSNREIERKLEEFGYISGGKLVEPFISGYTASDTDRSKEDSR